MDELTFGFMSSCRSAEQNARMFLEIRALAIRSFSAQHVCRLESFASDSIEDCHRILQRDTGQEIDALRRAYYGVVAQTIRTVRLPDIQSFFLYSFTVGVNKFVAILNLPEEEQLRSVPSAQEILQRSFPIYGPEWLTGACNKQMPSLENVFCDFQDEYLLPLMKNCAEDYDLVADAIAGTFLWAYFAGVYWLKEVVHDLRESVALCGGRLDPSGFALYPVKRALCRISNEEVNRAIALAGILRDPDEAEGDC